MSSSLTMVIWSCWLNEEMDDQLQFDPEGSGKPLDNFKHDYSHTFGGEHFGNSGGYSRIG